MKLSLAAAGVISLIFLLLGFNNRTKLETLRETRGKLTAEATRLGVSTDISAVDASPASRSRRERTDREAATRSIAVDFIAFAKEIQAIEKSGGSPEQLENFQQRVLDVMDRMATLDSTQLKSLIAEFRTATDLNDNTRQGLISFAVMSLANDHPRSAIELITGSSDLFPDGAYDKHLFPSTLSRWAQKDPTAAADWVRANADKFPELVTEEAKKNLIAGTATNDPKLAFQLGKDLGLTEFPYYNIMNAAKTPAERTATLAAFREHLTGITDENRRNSAIQSLNSLGSQLAGEGFAASTDWIASNNLSPEEIKAISNGISINVKSADAAPWIDWYGKNFPPAESTHAISQMVARWTTNDPEAAGQWLNSAADGSAKTTAIQAYARTVAPYEPQTAAQWAETLPPGKSRDTTLRTIHNRWPKSDPAGAAAFAEKHNIK